MTTAASRVVAVVALYALALSGGFFPTAHGANLRARAVPESLEAIQAAVGAEAGALFAAAKKPGEGWRFSSFKTALHALAKVSPKCRPEAERNVHFLLAKLCDCWTSEPPIKGCVAELDHDAEEGSEVSVAAPGGANDGSVTIPPAKFKIPNQGCGRISMETEYGHSVSHIRTNGHWDEGLLCGVHFLTQGPWIASVDNAHNSVSWTDDDIKTSTDAGVDFHYLVKTKFPRQKLPEKGGGNHGNIEMKTTGKGWPLTTGHVLDAHGALSEFLSNVNGACVTGNRNTCPRGFAEQFRKCSKPWGRTHMFEITENREDHVSDAAGAYSHSVKGLWIIDPVSCGDRNYKSNEIQITIDIPLSACYVEQTHGSKFIKRNIAERLTAVTGLEFVKAMLAHENSASHPVGEVFASLDDIGKADLRGMFALAENWVLVAGTVPKSAMNPQPRVDLTGVGQAFLKKHMSDVSNAATLWSSLGNIAATICADASQRFGAQVYEAEKAGGGKMTRADKCETLKAFFCGESLEACYGKSRFKYPGAGWNYGAYKVKTNRGPNIEVVIEARHMEASKIGGMFDSINKKFGKEQETANMLAPLVDDIRKAWNYNGDEGEHDVCAPDNVRTGNGRQGAVESPVTSVDDPAITNIDDDDDDLEVSHI